MVADYYDMPLVFEDCNSKYFEGEFDGIVWEFNGFGEYIGFLFGRFVGTIIFGILVFFLLCYFYYLGTGC